MQGELCTDQVVIWPAGSLQLLLKTLYQLIERRILPNAFGQTGAKQTIRILFVCQEWTGKFVLNMEF